ncbi:MAG: DUF3667 domain-containing protein [Flavobacterium sp.]|nr:MAG: DUF3667 domain-containing protein [Flavobacterium sp.]
MKSPACLNCDEITQRNYCSNCGQKTDTHRITLKHFLFHDIVHGVWHMDKGILFTLKQAILRPGKAAMEYIEGKRVRYYNVFYLILLMIGLGIFIESIYDSATLKFVSFATPDPVEDTRAYDVLGKYVKFFILLAIPAYALNSYILFNKKKLLYSEHLIIFGMYFVGIILISLFENIIIFTEFIESLAFIADWSNVIVSILLLIYIVKGLYDAFGSSYSKIGFSIRTIIYIALIFAEIRLLSFLILYYLDHFN